MINGDSDDGDTDATRPRHLDSATAPWGVLVERFRLGLSWLLSTDKLMMLHPLMMITNMMTMWKIIIMMQQGLDSATAPS